MHNKPGITTKRIQRKFENQSIPVNTAESNATGDRLSILVLVGVLFLAVVVLLASVYFSATGFLSAIEHAPVNWWKAIIMVLCVTAAAFIARSIAGIGLFGCIMLGTKMGAWKAVESVGRNALRFRAFLPGIDAWLTTSLVQSLVSRGQYEEVLAITNKEWDSCSSNEKRRQNLGTICFAAGIANQAQSKVKDAQLWNERAIEILKKSLEQLKQPQKGLWSKLMATQSPELMGQLRIQLAVAYMNNATIYFNSQDLRRAKENYKRAVEHAAKAPEFPQKSEIIKFGNEQLGRLKHS